MTTSLRSSGAAGILTFLLGMGAAAHIVEQEQKQPAADTSTYAAVAAAAAAAETWLHEVDAGHYIDSWEHAAALVREAMSSARWEQQLRAARGFGKLTSRHQKAAVPTTSLPGAPDGQYVVIQYAVTFEHGQALETVTATLEPDGQWRVAGYFIK